MYRARIDALSTAAGDGPPVVFAHGTLMNREMFAPQLAALADGYRAVAYDLRARTDRYAPGYDLWDPADDCAAVLDGLGEESAVIGVMSTGGLTALRFALAYPRARRRARADRHDGGPARRGRTGDLREPGRAAGGRRRASPDRSRRE